MKCMICGKEKVCWWCRTDTEILVVACISCAIKVGLRIIEEVLEAHDGEKRMEEGSSREG